jgi:Lrp/AsnC family leucine-responsive transcriptional regulator
MSAADASAALSILKRDAALAQRPWRWNPSIKSIVYLSGGTPPNMSGSGQQAMVLGILPVPFQGQYASLPRRAYASSASLRAERTRLHSGTRASGRRAHEGMRAFEARMMASPRVIQCVLVAGEIDYILLVRSRDVAHYQEFARRVVRAGPGVRSYTSEIVLTVSKATTEIPIDG